MILLDFSVSNDEDGEAVVLVTLGSTATPEYIAELVSRLGQEFTLSPK